MSSQWAGVQQGSSAFAQQCVGSLNSWRVSFGCQAAVSEAMGDILHIVCRQGWWNA